MSITTAEAAARLDRLRTEIAKKIVGQQDLVEKAMITLVAGGHILVEGLPGLGKTLLVRTLARAIGASESRVQFTPDLMPSDITGSIVLEGATGNFVTKKGPVFTHFFIADEVNRASAKTQAALFEAMQEYQVSLDGRSHSLPKPFMVLATENPQEHAGTYPLPDAQKDRFLMKVKAGYPSFEDEKTMVRQVSSGPSGGAKLSVESVKSVCSTDEFEIIQNHAACIFVDDAIIDYAVRIVSATRENTALRYGAGPRGSLALIRTARARALLQGRDFVLPDDVKALAAPVLSHRLSLSASSELEGLREEAVIAALLEKTEAPRI
ncbi:MAG: MoxR family ATPase [Spirochaetaceae bacterium]|jgi:MoxR-like ATPase|nr:MoxR family ATPase [Spirochaetaceae bacterium]